MEQVTTLGGDYKALNFPLEEVLQLSDFDDRVPLRDLHLLIILVVTDLVILNESVVKSLLTLHSMCITICAITLYLYHKCESFSSVFQNIFLIRLFKLFIQHQNMQGLDYFIRQFLTLRQWSAIVSTLER